MNPNNPTLSKAIGKLRSHWKYTSCDNNNQNIDKKIMIGAIGTTTIATQTPRLPCHEIAETGTYFDTREGGD